DGALTRLPQMPEWQDPSWVAGERFPPFAEALRLLHKPREPKDLLPEGPAWSRLAYDEFLAGQLALALMRAHVRRPAGRTTAGSGQIREKLIEDLPHSPTPSQGPAGPEVAPRPPQPERMVPRVQGGAGAGR